MPWLATTDRFQRMQWLKSYPFQNKLFYFCAHFKIIWHFKKMKTTLKTTLFTGLNALIKFPILRCYFLELMVVLNERTYRLSYVCRAYRALFNPGVQTLLQITHSPHISNK